MGLTGFEPVTGPPCQQSVPNQRNPIVFFPTEGAFGDARPDRGVARRATGRRATGPAFVDQVREET
jgi:hypothetical protein